MAVFTLYNANTYDLQTSQGKIPSFGTLGVNFLSDDVSAAVAAGTITCTPTRLTASSDLTAVAITYSGGGTPPATTVPAVTADATALNALATAFREIGRLRADVIRLTNDILNLRAQKIRN